MDPEPYDVLAVELSSFQLHYTDSMSAESAAVLNVAEDHLDWYAGLGDGRLRRRQGPDLRAGPARLRLQRRRPRRPSGWSARPTWSRAPARSASPSACPASGMVGVVEDILADRAFIEERRHQRRRAVHDRRPRLAGARTSSPTRWPPPPWPGPTASRQAAVRDGLRALPARRPPDRHGRRASTASPGSTTPRPPTRTPPSPRCRPTTPWCGSPAGWPRAPGSTTWSRRSRGRLRGVVLLGADRDVIADALSRHAPDVPVIDSRRRGD